MFRLDLICFTNSGISAARTIRVRPMIDSTQVCTAVGVDAELVEQPVPASRTHEMT